MWTRLFVWAGLALVVAPSEDFSNLFGGGQGQLFGSAAGSVMAPSVEGDAETDVDPISIRPPHTAVTMHDMGSNIFGDDDDGGGMMHSPDPHTMHMGMHHSMGMSMHSMHSIVVVQPTVHMHSMHEHTMHDQSMHSMAVSMDDTEPLWVDMCPELQTTCAADPQCGPLLGRVLDAQGHAHPVPPAPDQWARGPSDCHPSALLVEYTGESCDETEGAVSRLRCYGQSPADSGGPVVLLPYGNVMAELSPAHAGMSTFVITPSVGSSLPPYVYVQVTAGGSTEMIRFCTTCDDGTAPGSNLGPLRLDGHKCSHADRGMETTHAMTMGMSMHGEDGIAELNRGAQMLFETLLFGDTADEFTDVDPFMDDASSQSNSNIAVQLFSCIWAPSASPSPSPSPSPSSSPIHYLQSTGPIDLAQATSATLLGSIANFSSLTLAASITQPAGAAATILTLRDPNDHPCLAWSLQTDGSSSLAFGASSSLPGIESGILQLHPDATATTATMSAASSTSAYHVTAMLDWEPDPVCGCSSYKSLSFELGSGSCADTLSPPALTGCTDHLSSGGLGPVHVHASSESVLLSESAARLSAGDSFTVTSATHYYGLPSSIELDLHLPRRPAQSLILDTSSDALAIGDPFGALTLVGCECLEGSEHNTMHSGMMMMDSALSSMAMSYGSSDPNAEDCICQAAWTSPSDGGSCDQTQSGCTNDCSGGGYGGWCMVQNPGCAQEELSEGGGWAYCDLPGLLMVRFFTDGVLQGRPIGLPVPHAFGTEAEERSLAPWSQCGRSDRVVVGSPSSNGQLRDLQVSVRALATDQVVALAVGSGTRGALASYPASSICPALPSTDCVCQAAWTSPSDGGNCDQVQSGCTDDCSLGGWGHWCMLENPGCTQEEHSEGGGWAYCDPVAQGSMMLSTSVSSDSPRAPAPPLLARPIISPTLLAPHSINCLKPPLTVQACVSRTPGASGPIFVNEIPLSVPLVAGPLETGGAPVCISLSSDAQTQTLSLTFAQHDGADQPISVRSPPVPGLFPKLAGTHHIAVAVTYSDPDIVCDQVDRLELQWSGELCGSSDHRQGPATCTDRPDVGACDCYPEAVQFAYLGGGCDGSDHSQSGKAACSGGSPAGPATISCYNGHSVQVGLGGTFTLRDPTGGGYVRSSYHCTVTDGQQTQHLHLHTSCSKGLYVGDVFGALRVDGWDCGGGMVTPALPSSVQSNGTQAPFQVRVMGGHYGTTVLSTTTIAVGGRFNITGISLLSTYERERVLVEVTGGGVVQRLQIGLPSSGASLAVLDAFGGLQLLGYACAPEGGASMMDMGMGMSMSMGTSMGSEGPDEHHVATEAPGQLSVAFYVDGALVGPGPVTARVLETQVPTSCPQGVGRVGGNDDPVLVAQQGHGNATVSNLTLLSYAVASADLTAADKTCPPPFALCTVNNGGCLGQFGQCEAVSETEVTCLACPRGEFAYDATGCQDINECLINNGGCHPSAQCFNTDGASSCGPCGQGLFGDGILCISATATPTASPTPSSSATASATPTGSSTPTGSLEPSSSMAPSTTGTPSPTGSATGTPSLTAEPSHTESASATMSSTPTPTFPQTCMAAVGNGATDPRLVEHCFGSGASTGISQLQAFYTLANSCCSPAYPASVNDMNVPPAIDETAGGSVCRPWRNTPTCCCLSGPASACNTNVGRCRSVNNAGGLPPCEENGNVQPCCASSCYCEHAFTQPDSPFDCGDGFELLPGINEPFPFPMANPTSQMIVAAKAQCCFAPSATATSTSTASPTQAASHTHVATSSASASLTASSTGTLFPSPTPSVTQTHSSTASVSPTSTSSQTSLSTTSASLSISNTPSSSSSATATATTTPTPSGTISPTVSFTATGSGSPSASPTWSSSPTPSPTVSGSESLSPSPTGTGTHSASGTPTPLTTRSGSSTLTATASFTDTLTPSVTSSASSSSTSTTTASASPTASLTATGLSSLTVSLSASLSPTTSATTSGTALATSTLTTTSTPSAVPTLSSSMTRSASPSATSSGSSTPSRTASSSSTSSATGSATASLTASLTLDTTVSHTASATTSSSGSLSATPSPTVSSSALSTGTLSPSVSSSLGSTASPTQTPTSTLSPTLSSTANPSASLTVSMSQTGTSTPTSSPTPTRDDFVADFLVKARLTVSDANGLYFEYAEYATRPKEDDLTDGYLRTILDSTIRTDLEFHDYTVTNLTQADDNTRVPNARDSVDRLLPSHIIVYNDPANNGHYTNQSVPEWVGVTNIDSRGNIVDFGQEPFNLFVYSVELSPPVRAGTVTVGISNAAEIWYRDYKYLRGRRVRLFSDPAEDGEPCPPSRCSPATEIVFGPEVLDVVRVKFRWVMSDWGTPNQLGALESRDILLGLQASIRGYDLPSIRPALDSLGAQARAATKALPPPPSVSPVDTQVVSTLTPLPVDSTGAPSTLWTLSMAYTIVGRPTADVLVGDVSANCGNLQSLALQDFVDFREDLGPPARGHTAKDCAVDITRGVDPSVVQAAPVVLTDDALVLTEVPIGSATLGSATNVTLAPDPPSSQKQASQWVLTQATIGFDVPVRFPLSAVTVDAQVQALAALYVDGVQLSITGYIVSGNGYVLQWRGGVPVVRNNVTLSVPVSSKIHDQSTHALAGVATVVAYASQA